MAPVQGELDDDEVTLGHDAMGRGRWAVEVVVQRGEGLSKARTALRPGRVLDEVLGDEIEGGVVPIVQGLLKGHHGLGGRHRVITHDAASSWAPTNRLVSGAEPPRRMRKDRQSRATS